MQVRGMSFENLSRLNVLTNIVSANFLPVNSKKMSFSIIRILYTVFVWVLEVSYLTACIIGVFYVPKEKALQDSTVNIIVGIEVILLVGHLTINNNLLRRLIGKLDKLLTIKNQTLKNVINETIIPLEKPLRIYTIVLVFSVVFWTCSPLIKVYQRNEFYYEDYRIPARLADQPFGVTVFIIGVLFETFGAMYIILKKISLDIYTMHLILLVTSQYRFLKLELAAVLRNRTGNVPMLQSERNSKMGTFLSGVFDKYNGIVKYELKPLVHHHAAAIQITVLLKRLLALNVGLLYLTNVFRFSFLGFMIITIPLDFFFEKCLVTIYTIGAVTQLYVLCYCIEKLYEASIAVTDDAFYENWYGYDASIQRILSFMAFTKTFEYKLSAVGKISLTLPSFMSILNHAYSACIVFLRLQ